MNIFVLHWNPRVAARMHCDKHMKMAVEAVQMLSTAFHVLDPEGAKTLKVYKQNHLNHPCAQWVRDAPENFLWTLRLARYLLEEYDYRYGKPDKYRETRRLVRTFYKRSPFAFDWSLNGPVYPQEYVLAIDKHPECYSDDAVESYRKFYIVDKHRFATWDRGRKVPSWFRSGLKQWKRVKDIRKVIVT